jgi:hypothetical protein
MSKRARERSEVESSKKINMVQSEEETNQHVNTSKDLFKYPKELLLEVSEEVNQMNKLMSQMPKLLLPTYDLVILNGKYSQAELYLLPTNILTQEHTSLLKLATECGHPESNLFHYLDEVLFPDDSKKEQKRKKSLQKKRKRECIEGTNRNEYSNTKEEAERKFDLFENACELFYNSDFVPGPFSKFERRMEDVKDCCLRNTYMWTNVV